MSRTTTAAPLALVSDTSGAQTPQSATPLTAGQRLKAQSAQMKADAADGLSELVARIEAIVIETRDLAEVDTYSPETREALKQFAAYGSGSIDALGRQPKR